jgi:hypothetical protein
MESSGRTQVVPPGSIMANHNGPSAVRAVEGNLSGLSRRLKTGANILDAQAGAPPQSCSADLNRRCRLTEARYDLKLWITHSSGGATYLPR